VTKAATLQGTEFWRALVFCNTLFAESWTLRKNEEARLEAFEMKGLRKILRVSWTSKENK